METRSRVRISLFDLMSCLQVKGENSEREREYRISLPLAHSNENRGGKWKQQQADRLNIWWVTKRKREFYRVEEKWDRFFLLNNAVHRKGGFYFES